MGKNLGGYIGARTDTTQQSGQTPDKEVAIKPHYCLCQRIHRKPIRLECYLPTTAECLAPTERVCLFRDDSLARYLLQCAENSSVVAMDKTYLIDFVRDMAPLWDQRDKNYHDRDLKPKLWDEIGEKLNVAG